MPSQVDELDEFEENNFSVLSMSSYHESDDERIKEMIEENNKKHESKS